MKIIILFLLLAILEEQSLIEKVSEIEVQLIKHSFKRNSDYELTRRKTNRKSKPYSLIYFDKEGRVLKKISFGKHHNTDLSLTDKIKVYQYSEDKLIGSIIYESNYEGSVYPNWKERYEYDKNGNLIDDSIYYFESDSLMMRTTYEYDDNSNQIKKIYSSSYYLETDYDSIDRVKSYRQIYDNELKWEWDYEYLETKRVGSFKSHSNDDKDYSKEEIKTFDEDGLVIEIEEKDISNNGINEKQKYFYDRDGVIRRIEYYVSYSPEEYELISYTKIRVKSELQITENIAIRINEQIK